MALMQENLKQDYERSVKQGNLGHMIGFYIELKDTIHDTYKFDKGIYTIRLTKGNFIWWNYDGKKPKEKLKQNERQIIKRLRRKSPTNN